MSRPATARQGLWHLMLVTGCAGPMLGRSLHAQSTGPAATNAMAWTTINYLSGGMVYLEVGSKQGVREGMSLDVVRGSLVVAQLSATYVSSNKSACSVSSGNITLVVGDSIRFRPVQEAAVVAASQMTPNSLGLSPRRSSPVRGRVGVRYLTTQQPQGIKLNQPALDLRLDGAQIGGSGFGVAVDARTQRTAVSSQSTSAKTLIPLTRVYQAAVFFQPIGSRVRTALGRQFATTLSPIGIFDGATVDANFDRWSTGVLVGTQPDAVTFAPSTATTEFGVWVQRHSPLQSQTPWSATVGAIGSYDRGTINREFVYLRATYSSRRFSVYAAQEVDANRGWKLEVEGTPATLSSSFATAQVNIGDALTMSAGFDSRRSVRLYRDFLNPEIVFDDAFRQGTWGELSLRLSSRIRLSTDARSSGGGIEGGAQAITASLYANRLTSLQLGVRVRSTRFTSPGSEGTLTSVALEGAPTNAIRLSLNAGQRSSALPHSTVPAARLTWTGVDLDLALGRSVYLQLSTYRESGISNPSIQSYGAFSWRF